MNNIVEWIENLTPEFYIVIGLFVLMFLLLLVILIKIVQTHRRVGTQDFELLESISLEEGQYFYHVTIVNQSFSSNQIDTIGLMKKDVRHILQLKPLHVAPRNKVENKFLMDQIEELTIIGEKKYKKITVFAENEIGLRRDARVKQLNKYLRNKLKRNKKTLKQNAKAERFETGNYNFLERTGLIIKLLFRPFYKLQQRMKHRTNITLKESEVRRIQKSQHDQIKYKLDATVARSNELKVTEEAFKENKTRETELELLKQQKILEVEQLKQKTILEAYRKKQAEINKIDPKEEVKKYFEENPISYDDITEETLSETLEDLSIADDIEDLETLDGVSSITDPDETYLEDSEKEEIKEESSEKNHKKSKKKTKKA